MESRDEEKALGLNCGVHRRMSVRSSPTSSPRSTSPSELRPWSPITQTSPPETIILGLWPYATHEQIEYYVRGYGELYPSAKLLLLRYSKSYDQRVGDALDALTAADEKRSSHPRPNVLLHLFSGCGAAQGCRLLRAYKIRTGHRLAVKTVVMDTAPKPIAPSIRSATRSPKPLVNFFYIVMSIVYMRLFSTVNYWQFEERSRQNRRDLNDENLLPPDASKCYIFAEKDLMFSWHDSLAEDDEECVRENITVKRKCIDEKGRLTSDQERYWLGIENVWDSGGYSTHS